MDRSRTGARLNRPARATAFYTMTGLLLKGAAFLMTPFFTRALTSEEYGQYALFVSLEAFLALFAMPQNAGGVLLYGMQKYRERREDLLLTAGAGMLLTTAGTLAVFLLFCRLPGVKIPIYTQRLLPIAVIADVGIAILSAEARYRYAPGYPTAVSLLSGLLAPLAALVLIGRTNLRAEARILTATAAGVLLALPYIYKIGRKKFTRGAVFSREMLRSLTKNGMKTMPVSLSFLILSGADKLLIGRFCEAGDVGKYAIACSCAAAFGVFCTGAVSSLAPWMMRKMAAGEKRRIGEVLNTATGLLIPALLLFLCAIPEMLSIVAPSGYEGALTAVYPLTAAVLPLFFCRLFSQAGASCERPLRLSAPLLFASALALVGNILLLPRFGFAAAGTVGAVGYAVGALGLRRALRKLTGSDPVAPGELLSGMLGLSGGAALLWLLRGDFGMRVLCALPLLFLLAVRAKKAAALVREPRQKQAIAG